MEEGKAPQHFPSIISLGREVFGLPIITFGPMRKAEAVPRSNTGPKGASDQPVPVLVIPGMMSTDRSTSLLRRSLALSGYAVYGWGQGLNYGVQAEKLERLTGRLEAISQKHQRKPIVIGWSLGGLYARGLGGRCADMIGMIVTLASPFSGDRRANHAWRLYEMLNDHSVDSPTVPDDPSIKPPAHTIAIWARRDGVVDPCSARGSAHESDEQIAFDVNHCEVGASRRAVREIIGLLNARVDDFC